MVETDAAPGIHRVEDANVNWYLVEADDGLTIVDAGVPERARTELGVPVLVHEDDAPLAPRIARRAGRDRRAGAA